MRRRQFIVGLGSAAAWPVAARAQQGDRMRRIGVLMNSAATETEYQTYLAAFMEGVRQSGWTEGQNLYIDVRWNGGDAGLARAYAAQLIALMPDVILVVSTLNLMAIRQTTTIVPVVFVQVNDPIAQGFVASVKQPGGNLTGFSMFQFSLGSKWIDLLKKVAPGLERVAVMFNPDTAPYWEFFMPVIEAAAQSLGMQAIAAPVRDTADIEPALASFARQPNGGLILLGDSFAALRYSMIADLAGRYRLPSIGPGPNFAKDGALMEYSNIVDLVGQYRQAASYVDRILKGSKPGDLPVQTPDKYGFLINMKTAKTLGIEVPPTLLAIADEVIQ